MKEINSTFANKFTSILWNPMHKVVETNLGKRTSIRNQLERDLHDRLESRIKFGVMIPIEWRINTTL